MAMLSACAPTTVVSSPIEAGRTHQIQLKDLLTGIRTPLTDDPDHEHYWPRPSPDGTRILFYKADPGRNMNDPTTNSLWMMDADGTGQHEIIPEGTNGWSGQGHAEWSPDGTRLVMMAATAGGAYQLWTAEPDGTDPIPITNRPLGTADPSWGHDGTYVLFVGCPTSFDVCSPTDTEVFRLDLASGTETQLTEEGPGEFHADNDPRVTPDGRTLVWIRWMGTPRANSVAIMTAQMNDPLGTGRTLLGDDNANGPPDISPDGTTLVFSRQVYGDPTLHSVSATMNIDGTGVTNAGWFAAPTEELSPAWMPTPATAVSSAPTE
ncbi:MAG: hypothetical protein R2698_14135 [Microthrixaceae bacterium]